MNQTLDDIRSESDMELIRLYRFTLLRNRKGRLDDRLRRMIAETLTCLRTELKWSNRRCADVSS